MKSVMNHRFSEVPSAEIPRSSFDRSHGLKTTFNAGYLVPIFVDEALPGDTFNLKMDLFGRLATPKFPIMDNMFLETFFFAIPIRLIWENWQKFNGEQENPGDSTDFLVPQVTAPPGGFQELSIYDYLGLPTKVENISVSAFWNRAIQLTWNEWFRDQNIQDSLPVQKDDGPDDPSQYTLLKRGKRHDYFTSSLPWPQKGEAVDIPLGTKAEVAIDATLSGQNIGIRAPNLPGEYALMDSSSQFLQVGNSTQDEPDQALYADLTTATAATINTLRTAFQIQKLLERDARGGSRYTELIRSHFGVVSPDSRLQRPEYLGGGSERVSVHQVANTAGDPSGPEGAFVGDLAAFGTVTGNNHGFTKSFTEHCVLVGFVNLCADLNYQQGINRMFNRRTRYDHYWPAFAHLGEQEVLNKEIYAQGTSADEEVFGYQERHAEYRYKPSMITGLFRSNAEQTLDPWHLAQDFANLPTLSPEFIEDDPPIDRAIALPNQPHMILDCYARMHCARPMPLYSVPGLIDHF